jgi:hypothetical protein
VAVSVKDAGGRAFMKQVAEVIIYKILVEKVGLPSNNIDLGCAIGVISLTGSQK